MVLNETIPAVANQHTRIEHAELNELTCAAKCEYAARDNDVGKQEESEWSTEVLEVCRLVFGKVHP
jgi:hypothetical protein